MLIDATELFINVANNSDVLDAMNFNPFGKVVRGMDVVHSWYTEYGEMHGGSYGDGLCEREFAYTHYPDAPCNGVNPDMLYNASGGNEKYFDVNFPKLTKIQKIEISNELRINSGSDEGFPTWAIIVIVIAVVVVIVGILICIRIKKKGKNKNPIMGESSMDFHE